MAHHQNANSVFYATTYHPIQAGSIDGTDTASHDNGVYRALLASSTGLYDPTGDPKAEGDPYNTLFIGRLAHHTTEKTLHETMSKYGRVKKLRLVRHIVTGASRGYAFVEFETENDMQNAYEMAHYYVIDGSQILVDYNRQQLMPGWIPRRLGGGLGGHKESGQLRFGGRDRPFRAPLRTIPQEQLIKLGIPLPPVGRYMSRFQIPPTPRRPGSFKEGSHYRRKGSYKRSPSLETLPSNILANKELVEMEQRAELSPKAGKRPADSERGSGTHKEHTSRQTSRGDAEENFSNERYHRHEEGKEHKKRRFSEHRDEQVDERKFTRSGQEDRGSDEHHERSANRSDYKEKRSGHHERSTSKSGHKHRDSGHRHKRERETRECSRDLDRSPKHGSEESRRSRSKRRSRDDKMSDV